MPTQLMRPMKAADASEAKDGNIPGTSAGGQPLPPRQGQGQALPLTDSLQQPKAGQKPVGRANHVCPLQPSPAVADAHFAPSCEWGLPLPRLPSACRVKSCAPHTPNSDLFDWDHTSLCRFPPYQIFLSDLKWLASPSL